MMKVKIVADPTAGGKAGYELFAAALENNARVFGLATGSTPISTYDEITASNLDFSKCISINLDEYVSLAPTHPQSYHAFMQEHFFDKKPFSKSYVPDGLNPDEQEETARYEKLIAENPIDFQILGLGRNGHIGFNEPGTPFDSITHRVELTQSTIDANARFFDNEKDVPRYAYSMGIGTIMKSKEILIEAYGENKADAVKKMIEEPSTEQVPASVLQQHSNVTVLIDQAAASKLTKKY
ncbi:glucosamine-6-phosphate deaminase [Paucilactobacillus hokkaidonensis JCM 18461]|uniref:Glucosamine-6-phosphate deaminase n=3 Tax=Paucilactobacillus hokkaidonensis TaxID=1193095 RepID=A0A0A1GW10_9LACO|nr:glucosamine-6-phosphate deaminase [Paucilactobacillus hokkaidonensis JCM 18461]